MDSETWQTNLESWRERRRAVTRAFSLEIQQQCPSSPSPLQDLVDSVTGITMLSNFRPNIQENRTKIKTPEKSASDFADGLTAKKVTSSVSSGIVKNSPFLLSDAERFKHLNHNVHEKRSPTRIRLVCDPNCVKANDLGLIIAALGDNDGPPFVIRDLVKDSMAERGNLQIGDELFSVDNLCCTFASDRPILISNLTKLHQLLQRLTDKRRPVEVKVFRDKNRDSERGQNSASDRFHGSGESVTYSKKVASLSDGLSHSRSDEGRTAENGASGSGGIVLIELEKAQPVKAIERILPSSEHAELKYSDCGLITSISPSRIEMASTISTTKSRDESANLLVQPVSASFTETVNTRQIDYDNTEGCHSDSQRKYEGPTSILNSDHSYSLTFEEPVLPPPPALTSSDSLVVTPSETPLSIGAIQPPPTPPDMGGSIMERHHSNSLVLSLPPTPPLSTPSSPTSLILDISSDHHRSNAYQDQYVEAMVNIDSKKSTFNLAQMRRPTAPSTKTSSSDDLIRNDVITNNRSCAQYGGDINSDDTRPIFNPSAAVRYGWKSESSTSDSEAENRPSVTSDIDSDVELHNHLNKPSDRQVKREQMIEESQTTEEIESKILSITGSEEEAVRLSKRQTYHCLGLVVGTENPETRIAEMVTLSPLQSVELQSEILQSKATRESQCASVDAPVRWNKEEIENRPHKKLRSSSKRGFSDSILHQQNSPSNRPPRVHMIGTWYTCAGCNQQLGSSDLMVIEQLNFFYHLSCFVCARCGIQLSDGQKETSVRIRNGLIYCHICYHRLSKPLSGSKGRNKPKDAPESKEYPSLSRTPATLGPLKNTSSQYKTDSKNEKQLMRSSLSHF